MNLLYLSPHYPSHYGQFVESLARHGVRVFGISDLPDDALDPRVSDSMTAHRSVDQLENKEQILNACEFFSHNFGKIDRVESHLEPWLEMEAVIREKFDVTGPKPDELLFIKRKSKMKDVFTKAGVPCARGMVVTTFEECKKFIGKEYPVFIKPDIGVGAVDTYTIKSEDDLKHFFEVKQTYDYFMEDYVKGDIISYDGLTDSNGEIVFQTSHIFSNDIHNAVKNNENIWYYSLREIPAIVEKYGREIVKQANVREKFFHIEFFKVEDKYLALEINMRPPGGITTHMFNFACDIDVYDWWASIIGGKESRRDFERKFHSSFIGRKHDRNYKYSHDDLYAKWGCDKIVHAQPMNPIEYTVMGHWGYITKTSTADEMKEIISDFMAEV